MKQNIDALCQKIRDEIRRNKKHHLKLAQLLLQLKGQFEKEKDFFTRVEEEFGLAERTTYQYVEVARKTHVHHLDLDFSKLYLLSKLSERELRPFLRRWTPKKLAGISVRSLEDAIRSLRDKKNEQGQKSNVIHFLVAKESKQPQSEMTAEESQIVEDLRAVIDRVKDLSAVSISLKSKLETMAKDLREALDGSDYNWLTQNRKMAKMSGAETYNWAIPSDRVVDGIQICKNAASCAKGCYAVTGLYRLPRNLAIAERRFRLSRSDKFVSTIDAEIKRRNIRRLRLHDGGDFYSEKYLNDWIDIMRRNPKIEFYTYTKMVSWLKRYDTEGKLPKNFSVVYSFGGTEDKLIDVERDLHSIVFANAEELEKAGYVDAHVDDSVVLITPSKKVGLIHHGPVNHENSDWEKVKKAA